jgi:hypothetical protein
MIVTDNYFPLKMAQTILTWLEGSLNNLNDSVKFKIETIEGSEFICKISYDSDYIGTLLMCTFNAGDKNGYERAKGNNVLSLSDTI